MPRRDLVAYAGSFARFPGSLRRYLADPLSLAEVRRHVREGIERREQRSLDFLRKSVYNHPPSPYRPLLVAAGWAVCDVKALVASRGVEGALRDLRAAGVYVTFEEFKGHRPTERDGRTTAVAAADFDTSLPGATCRSRRAGRQATPPSSTRISTMSPRSP